MVMRPGDANEVSEAYRVWLREKHEPMTLVLSRQNLPTLDRTKFASADGTAKGAYVLANAKEGEPQVILMATGSELAVTTEAYEKLASQGVAARLVSVPCWELFDKQDQEYRDSVLPPSCTARVAVEAGVVNGWEKYLGPKGQFVGMTTYGAQRPGRRADEVLRLHRRQRPRARQQGDAVTTLGLRQRRALLPAYLVLPGTEYFGNVSDDSRV